MALWCLTHCMTETLLVTLQNRAREDSCMTVNSLEKRDMPWRYTSKAILTGVPAASSMLICWALCQQDPEVCTALAQSREAHGCCGAGRVPCCRDKALSISTLQAWAASSACTVCIGFTIFRRISRLWKYFTICVGCYLTSSIYLMEDNMQKPWWSLPQWFLLSSEEEKWLVSEQCEPTLPGFTPTRPLDFSVIQISHHINLMLNTWLSLRSEPRWRKRGFYTCMSEQHYYSSWICIMWENW